MNKKNLYEKLAKLTVIRGLNVQKGQYVNIRSEVKNIEFVRMVVEESYKAGASHVEVDFSDTELTKLRYQYASIEALSDIPDWQRAKLEHLQKIGYCNLSISSSMPGALKDVDGKKINAFQKAYQSKLGDLSKYFMNNEGQWCVIGLPSVEWAKVIFPNDSDEMAFEKLEQAIFDVCRIDETSDPIENWKKHDEELIDHANILNEKKFKQLHFTSELGTDLYVDLVQDHIWVGGGCFTPAGVYFDPNIPTEETFCMPHRLGVNGIVYASKPLSLQGKVVEDFWFSFKDGKVVDYGAKCEQDALKDLVEFDEGSCRLGEVALVPYDSPISKSNILFFNTLFDENAACHLALGRCYPENVLGGVDMSIEELNAIGGNWSMQHVDFMFGTKEMSIDGIQTDGTIVPVFRNGNFVIGK